MSIQRRIFIQAGAAALGATVGLARSQPTTGTWPTKPVRLVVPFPAGAGVDIATRTLGDQLQAVWGGAQPVVVDNKPGGNTIIAVNTLLNAPKDGHTFLVTINATFLLPYLGQKLPFDPMGDLVPVGAITTEQLVLVGGAKLGARKFGEMVERLRSNPVGAEFGSFGQGSLSHLLALQIAREKNVHPVIAHYRGTAPTVQGLLTGEIGMTLGNIGAFQPFIASGKAVPLAVTGEKRSPYYPDVPTLKEVGISGMDNPAWIGVFAAKGAPADPMRKMAADMHRALQKPELVQKMHGYFQEPGLMSADAFQALLKRDVDTLGGLIGTHGVRIE